MKSSMRKIAAGIGLRTEVCVRFEFADGSSYQNRAGAPALTVRFRTPRAQWKTALFGHIGLLDSYFAGDVDVDGSTNSGSRTAPSRRRSRTRGSTTASAPSSTGCGSMHRS